MINWISVEKFFDFVDNNPFQTEMVAIVGETCWVKLDNGIRMALVTHYGDDGNYSYLMDANAIEWRLDHDELKKVK